jgi:hypothetical protein
MGAPTIIVKVMMVLEWGQGVVLPLITEIALEHEKQIIVQSNNVMDSMPSSSPTIMVILMMILVMRMVEAELISDEMKMIKKSEMVPSSFLDQVPSSI